MIADKIEALLADKGYDADAIREELTKADVEAVIPAKSNRREPIAHDREKYRWRNLVERLFNKLKNWRRIATRYDKTKESYLGFVNLVSVLQWIPLSTKPNGFGSLAKPRERTSSSLLAASKGDFSIRPHSRPFSNLTSPAPTASPADFRAGRDCLPP
jgi:transposase